MSLSCDTEPAASALALPFAYHVGRCDNFWCSRIGFLEGHFVGGELAAWLCAGECEAYSEPEDEP